MAAASYIGILHCPGGRKRLSRTRQALR